MYVNGRIVKFIRKPILKKLSGPKAANYSIDDVVQRQSLLVIHTRPKIASSELHIDGNDVTLIIEADLKLCVLQGPWTPIDWFEN